MANREQPSHIPDVPTTPERVSAGAEKERLGLNEVREIFGPDFIGIEEVERFTERLLTLGEEKIAEEKWQKKIKEQGLTKKGLKQLKREGFMVVLRVGTLAGK